MLSSFGITAGASAALCCYYLVREIRKCQGFMEFDKKAKSGGQLVAEQLVEHGIKEMFVLSGGHVSPIYCSAEELGIKVVDVRHEVNAAFAADASWRLTGRPGIVCVTAGPGVTNTVTAVQNALMAESAVVVLGGCTGTLIKGRGSLQDIDHLSLMKTVVKWSATCSNVAQIVPTVRKALQICQQGVPGPVFVELPTDLLYPADHVIGETSKMLPRGKALFFQIVRAIAHRHTNNLYINPGPQIPPPPLPVAPIPPSASKVGQVYALLASSKKPVLVIGSQSMQQQAAVQDLVEAVLRLGVPVFAMGMARGLLGGFNDAQLQFRHKRSACLKQADVVVLCGAVLDFRLQYGAGINARAKLVVVNKKWSSTVMNRIPSLSVVADPALFLTALAKLKPDGCQWPAHAAWISELRKEDAAQELSIRERKQQRPKQLARLRRTVRTARGKAAADPPKLVNPLHVCRLIDEALTPDSVLVLDGGDFVGTAAYTVTPRKALSWLDPGAFGTLGVGAGFAMGAKTAFPESLVWIIYGDGAFGFSLAELDTFVRFKMGVICVLTTMPSGQIGNDAGWTQILRDQQVWLKMSTACTLEHTNYHLVGEGFGAKGFLISKKEEIKDVLEEAKAVARTGRPCVVNCLIARNDFREGSISV